MTLTQSELKERLKYDPETGIFTWRIQTGRSKVGAVAGNVGGTTPYRQISIAHKLYRAHRLAWLYVYGEFPAKGLELDHINGIPDDNRIANLRIATLSQNSANSKVYSTNRLGVRGVTLCKRTGKYFARIKYKGKTRHLGTFDSLDKASERFSQEAKLIWGDYFREAAREE